jgi:hypothetical protein
MIVYVKAKDLHMLLLGADLYLRNLHESATIMVDTSVLVNLGGIASHCPEPNVRAHAERALERMQHIRE